MPNANSLRTLQDAGERYQQLRRAAGKTQSEVAEAAGLRQETLSRFERGRASDLSSTKLLRLLEVLGLQMAFEPATRRPDLNELLQERRQGSVVVDGKP